MYKLTEKEYLEKKKKFKETFVYSRKNKQITLTLILLAISLYILFNGIVVFTYLIFNANDKSLVNKEELLDFMITFSSTFLTLGITGALYCIIKLISLGKEKEEMFKDFIEKK